MKRSFLLIIILLNFLNSFAQTDSLTTRDDSRFKYLIRKSLLPKYEALLNYITDSSSYENEINEAINYQIYADKESKLFTSNKVIIENDLKSGSDTGRSLRRDMELISYLKEFNTGYKKTEDKSIFLNLISISPLKYTTYYYYSVEFLSSYNGENYSGDHFNTVNRVAEIKLVNDSGWHLYINSIRFSTGTETDTTNQYNSLIQLDTNVVNLLSEYDNLEQQRIKEQKRKIQVLLEDGEDRFMSNDYEGALRKFKEARFINTDAKEAKDAVAKTRKVIANQKLERKKKEERDAHVLQLKEDARHFRDNYNFKAAKIICDSLKFDYGQSDKDIDQMNDELSKLISVMDGINAAVEKKDLSKAKKLCKANAVDEKKNNFSRSEFFYQLALLNNIGSKPDVKLLLENLNNSILLSKDKHQEAIKFRSKLNMDNGEVVNALQDASLIINNDSRNPDNFYFRAVLYEKDNNINKAIDDYASAIKFKATDPFVFLNKARLEYKRLLFNDIKKTTTEGLAINKCNGMLYFYRGLANVKTDDFLAAGSDFRGATIKCGVNDSAKTAIKSLSNFYFLTGDTLFNKKKIKEAINEFRKSILIDSNETSIYMRAKSFLYLNLNDSALIDFNALLFRKPMFKDAHSQRGITYTNINNFVEANRDFDIEIKNYPDNAAAFYAKGQSEIVQKKYGDAIVSLEKSAVINPSDSSYYFASLACYIIKDYPKAILLSAKARNKRTTRSEVFYICGRAYYDSGKFYEAIKEFSKAKELVTFNEDLLFWSASAFEANKNYSMASNDYDKLNSSKKYQDTVAYRSAVCLVKYNNDQFFKKAIRLLEKYIYPIDSTMDLASAYTWMAYTYLKMDSLAQADLSIAEAKKYNDKNVMLQLVQACAKVKSKMNDNAFSYLENALISKLYSKDEINDEKMLSPISKTDKYKSLMKKYYP